MTFLESLSGAGPYLSVFIGLTGALLWAMKDRTRILTALENSNERLLAERDKRAKDNMDAAKMLSDSSQKIADHTRVLEKVLDQRWTLSHHG